jgi:hypothetical protein
MNTSLPRRLCFTGVMKWNDADAGRVGNGLLGADALLRRGLAGMLCQTACLSRLKYL